MALHSTPAQSSLARFLTGLVFILISAASFGALPIFARMAYDNGSEPVTVLFFRFLFAGIIMGVIFIARRLPLPDWKTLAGLAAMGGIGYVGQSFSYFTALTYASAGLVALLLYLYPAIVACFDALLFKQKMTPGKIIALFLATGGAALTIGPAAGGRVEGILLALAAALIYSGYILAGSRLQRQANPVQTSTVIIFSAFVVYGLICAFRGLNPPDNFLGWLGILGLAVVSTVVAVFTFMTGMERVGPTNASALSTFEPVVTLLLAYWVLGESFTLPRLAGGALILGAVVLLARGEVKAAQASSKANL